MIDGEKRIVTFMGEAGKKTASIIYRQKLNLFEVLREQDTIFFRNESEAQTYAEEFCWGKNET
jgi:hypothetical protein